MLDPANIEVVAFGGETNNLNDVDAFDDLDVGTAGETRLNAAVINNATANVILQATNNITFNANVNIASPGIGLTAQAGNNIVVDNFITTNNGQIQLIANDASSGMATGTGAIAINSDIQSNGGNILLRAGGDLSVNNAAVVTQAFAENAGDISVETGRLLLQNFGRISTATLGAGNAGDITIRAAEIEAIAPAAAFFAFPTGIGAVSELGATGDAGKIAIETERLSIRNGAQIIASTFGSGKAGEITIQASEIELIGESSANPSAVLASNAPGSTGSGGKIALETGRLAVRDGAGVYVSTAGSGDAGELTIRASEIELAGSGTLNPSVLSAQVRPEGTNRNAAAGQVTIETERLLVGDGAQINAGSINGNAGNLTIQATESVDAINGGILAAAATGTGAGGKISIDTRLLTLQNGSLFAIGNTGSAGSITLSARESVTVNQGSLIATGSIGSGAGGNIEIDTGNLIISDGGLVGTLTLGQGNAGNLIVRAANSVNIIGNQTGLFTSADGTGGAGNLAIATGQLLVQDGGQLNASSVDGNAGNLTIQATDSVTLVNNSSVLASSTGMGVGGNILIDTSKLTLDNGAAITTGTIGEANAGSITVRSSESVSVSQGSLLSTSSLGSGTGGNLDIETGNLTVRDSGRVITLSAGQGNAGNLTVRAANSVNVINGGGLTTGTLGIGAGGNLSIATRTLNVLDGGLIFTSSIDAATLELTPLDPNLYASTDIELIRDIINAAAQGNFAQGDSGNLTVSATDSVSVANKGSLTTLATGQASGGSLSIETPRLTVQNQGSISTDTEGSGNAGVLDIRANNSVEVTGGSRITTQARAGSTGNGGTLTIKAGDLAIQDEAQVSSATFGQGRGGDIQLQANSLALTNSGRITSRSEGTSNAGNISINLRDDLRSQQGEIVATSTQAGGGNVAIAARDIRLDNSSLISTSVLDSTGGGGNITIDSDVFIALDDSDILANADAGAGGDITINSPAFVAELFSSGRATAVGRNPGDFSRFRGNDRVDISADSRTGRSGTVELPELDPSRGLIQLPSNFVNTTGLIDRQCSSGSSARRNSFIVTGRGGIPQTPTEPLSSDTVWVDLVTPNSESGNIDQAEADVNSTSTTPKQIVEAQGWVKTPDGQIILVAEALTVTHHNPWSISASCRILHPSSIESMQH